LAKDIKSCGWCRDCNEPFIRFLQCRNEQTENHGYASVGTFKNFELEGAKIYEKNNNNFSISTGSDFLTPHSLALVAKTYGAFDYSFTQIGKNHASFTSGYTDYERSKDYKGLTFNSISYYDGKISTDKINLKTSAKWLSILPAKPVQF
jgi:hypothetical protein